MGQALAEVPAVPLQVEGLVAPVAQNMSSSGITIRAPSAAARA